MGYTCLDNSETTPRFIEEYPRHVPSSEVP